MPDALFRLFTEIGIIEQLNRAALEAQLPDGLIAPHFAVLSHLIRVQDGCTPLELARAHQTPKTSMTHTLAGLERRALVEMRPNPADARSKQVWLLPAGRAVPQALMATMAPRMARLGGVVGAEEVARALDVLEKLRKALDAARD